MKQKVVILSDIFGEKNKEWISPYLSFLKQNFSVHFYNCIALAEMENLEFNKASIHEAFIEKGIDKAVENLIKLEKEPLLIIGFSIGGTIAWKAALNGLKVEYLILLSATRIRYETEKPNTKISLIYGENDLYQPDNLWFDKMKITPKIIKNEGHEFYSTENLPISDVLGTLKTV